jgi:hypothetical protein
MPKIKKIEKIKKMDDFLNVTAGLEQTLAGE